MNDDIIQQRYNVHCLTQKTAEKNGIAENTYEVSSPEECTEIIKNVSNSKSGITQIKIEILNNLSPFDFLIKQIESLPAVNNMGEYDPDKHKDSWMFYVLAVAQQCGTKGNLNQSGVSCSKLWRAYFSSWTNNRKAFFSDMSFTAWKHTLDFYGIKIAEQDSYIRYMMNQELVKYLGVELEGMSNGDTVAEIIEGVINNTTVYSADPWGKKKNLLLNILTNRPELVAAKPYYTGDWDNLKEECGPVIDYHVMRVLMRYFGFSEETIESTTEEDLEYKIRGWAYNIVYGLNGKSGQSYNKIDRFIWRLGKTVCARNKCDIDNCPLAKHCATKSSFIVEPLIDTWFY